MEQTCILAILTLSIFVSMPSQISKHEMKTWQEKRHIDHQDSGSRSAFFCPDAIHVRL